MLSSFGYKMSSRDFKRVLVTGANKGIGLALVEKILAERPDTFVYLGARDIGRGNAARDSVVAKFENVAHRIEVLNIDVASDSSVTDAATALGSVPLYALVNNAGVWGTPDEIFNTNLRGVNRCDDAFLPALKAYGPGSRIVNTSSGAAPMFVAKCTPERQAILTSKTATVDEVLKSADEFLAALKIAESDDSAALNALGYPPFDGQAAYGASKAFLNAYALALSKQLQPQGITVNGCSPGFVATDLLAGFFNGRNPAEMGAITPAEGTKSLMFLLFSDDLPSPGTGLYFGSDALRSPLDKYRSPGSPAYTGE